MWLAHKLGIRFNSIPLIEVLGHFLRGAELCLFEVADYDGGQEFVHALFVGDIGVASAPNEEEKAKEFADGLFLEEFHFLVSSLDVFVDFLF